MQDETEFRTNRDLFSNHYLDEHLPDTDAWEAVGSTELQEAYDDIVDLWERERDLVADRNESQLEEKFIRPMFRKLGVPFEVEESVEQGQRRPDYGFFESDEGARSAFTRRRDGGDFYKNAIAVADAKRWGRKLDTRGEQQRDFENPSYQIHVYLQETPTTWAVLTNGEYWRLYYGPTSHRLDSYYEIHLPTVLKSGDLEAFKYFYLFFQHEAFLPDTSGDCFLDDVYSESNVFAEELGEDLQDNIYDAIQSLAEGFLTFPENDLGVDDLDLIHDSSLIYLYRLIFVLYAESEGRDLLNTDNEIYEQSYSLNTIKQEVAEELDSDQPNYQIWQSNLWNRIDELFQLIDQGSASRNIPEEDLHIPAYNGGLFRTNPDSDDSPEAQFLATHAVGDEYLARVIELLSRSQTGSTGKIFVDYSSLDVRHLGSVYEGLLEYQLNVADEPLTLDDGEYALATEDDEVVVEPDEVYLTTDSGERKATGSYYTPEYVVEYIVENTLEPLVDDIREDLAGFVSYEDDAKSGFAEEFADRIFELKILDPAMGSGHFLTNTIDYLAREIIDAQERQAEQQGVETVGQGQDINWARRQVAQHCIYGVDLNPLAVELAKVSLWLRTLAAEQPLAFLDHHLKTGNSLVGSDIEAIDELETDANGGPNASLAEFGAVRRGTIDHLMDVYEEFIAIENTDLADAKAMERKHREIERDDLRNRLVAMANVETAEEFNLDLPGGAYERMARALDDDSEWAAVADTDWFRTAQAMADERNFLHWKLEFPEVFYEVDGSDRENPGFDAVIGNPPYVRMEEFKPIKPFLRQKYDVHADRMDLYGYFVEQAVNLIAKRKHLGYIVSNKWLRANYGEPIRNMIVNRTTVRRVVDFKDLPVFDEARTYPLILVASKEQSAEAEGMAVTVPDLDFSDLEAVVKERSVPFRQKHLREAGWATLGNPGFSLLARMQREYPQLSDYIGSPTLMGIKSGRNEAFVIDEQKRNELIKTDEKSAEIIHPLRTGRDVRRYWTEDPGTYLIYAHHGVNINRYPAIEEHLGQFREQLEDRATKQRWYELQQPQEEYEEKFKQSKIIQPDLAEGVRFHLDTDGHYPTNKIYFLPTGNRYLLAVLNSQLADFYLVSTTAAYRGGYIQLLGQYVEELPIHEAEVETSEDERESAVAEAVDAYQSMIEPTGSKERNQYLTSVLDLVETHLAATPERADVVHELLAELAGRMGEFKEQRNALNLSLPDYLGSYDDGQSLGERYQPPAGVADSILTDTATERANLRVRGRRSRHVRRWTGPNY